MAFAKFTLVGFYNYMEDNGTPLFAGLTVPTGIDKDVLVKNILIKGGEFEPLYANPEFMATVITNWSAKWSRTMQKWVDAFNIKYDPLYNYDRIEEYDDERNSQANTKSLTEDISHGESSGSSTNTRSAFDSDQYEPHDKNDTGNETDTSAQGSVNADTTGKETMKHRAHLYGNIGVTTSQQMLQSELDIAEWNIYEHITDLFLEELVLMIY